LTEEGGGSPYQERREMLGTPALCQPQRASVWQSIRSIGAAIFTVLGATLWELLTLHKAVITARRIRTDWTPGETRPVTWDPEAADVSITRGISARSREAIVARCLEKDAGAALSRRPASGPDDLRRFLVGERSPRVRVGELVRFTRLWPPLPCWSAG